MRAGSGSQPEDQKCARAGASGPIRRGATASRQRPDAIYGCLESGSLRRTVVRRRREGRPPPDRCGTLTTSGRRNDRDRSNPIGPELPRHDHGADVPETKPSPLSGHHPQVAANVAVVGCRLQLLDLHRRKPPPNWARTCNRRLEDVNRLEHVDRLRFEDLVTRLEEETHGILAFLEIEERVREIDPIRALSVHEREEDLRDMSYESVARLFGADARAISWEAEPVFRKMGCDIR